MTQHSDVVPPARHREVVVRTATPKDYDAIRDVVADAYHEYAAQLPPALWKRYLADLLDLERHARYGRLIVAEVDGVVRGSGAFYSDIVVQGVGWPAGWAGGRALAVHTAARGYGLAKALLAECERLARAAGAPVFALHSASFMTSAVALYERAGYRRAPEFDLDLHEVYGDTGTGSPRIIAFRRDLGQVAA